MSVLLLGADPITHRRCEGDDLFDLLDWFAMVEMHAWTRVDSYFKRPNEIFLVTGQHLTSTYAISHKQYGSSDCEVVLDCSNSLPSSANASVLAQARVTKVHASMGFEAVVGLANPHSTQPVASSSPLASPELDSSSTAESDSSNHPQNPDAPPHPNLVPPTPPVAGTILYSIFLNQHPFLKSGPLQKFKATRQIKAEEGYK
jgi:hypothetical protein